jgi:vacuolar-type H+-ATPase subunit H
MDILYLLDRLDEMVASASRVPFSSRVIIDEQDYLDIVDQIRLALPEELKVSRRVIAERDQILTEAGEQARRLVEQGQQEATELVNQHSIVRTAESRAHSLRERAERDAQETRSQADDYAFRVLSALNNRLLQLGNQVQEGLAELRPERRRLDD